MRRSLLPLGLGVAVALGCVVLLQARMIWLALFAVGLLVVIGSFVSRQPKLYWLAVFLASVPLNITKLLFFSPEDLEAMKIHYHLDVFENLVPQLYLSDLPLLILLALWLGELLTERRRIRVPRGLLIALGFIAWCLVTLIVARAPGLGLVWIFYQLKNVLIFLWLVNLSWDRRMLRVAVAVLLAGMALQGLMTVYTYAYQVPGNVWGSAFGAERSEREMRTGPARGTGAGYVYETGDLLRGRGSVGIGNLEAMYFVMLLPLALTTGLVDSGLRRVVWMGIFALGLGGLMLTFSRGGLVTVGVALLTLGLLVARRRLVLGKTAALIAVLGLAVVALMSPLLIDYLSSRPTFLRTRFDHIYYGFVMLMQHPALGVGINNFPLAITPHEFHDVFRTHPVHNHYLRIAIETGLPGLAIYLLFPLWVVVQGLRAMWAEDRFLSATAMALLASVIGIAAYWLNDLFYEPVIRTQFWIVLALIVVVRQLALRERQAAPEPGVPG